MQQFLLGQFNGQVEFDLQDFAVVRGEESAISGLRFPLTGVIYKFDGRPYNSLITAQNCLNQTADFVGKESFAPQCQARLLCCGQKGGDVLRSKWPVDGFDFCGECLI